MKRKSRNITIIIVAALFLIGFFVAYQVWIDISGEVELRGPVEIIPKGVDVFSPIKKGKADWPYWRGLNHDGKSTLTGVRKNWHGGLPKLWEVDFLCQGKHTATWSAPVIQGNRLVTPGRDEKKDLVFCLDPDSGELIWLGSCEAEANTSYGPGARATPFIDYDRVYTFGRSGDLACWRLRDGELLWKQNVRDEGGEEPTWGHSSSPLVFEDKVIIQGGGKALILAYDKITGHLAWKSMEGDAGYAAPTLMISEEGAKLLIFHGNGLVGIEPARGDVLWSIPWETDYGVNATTPTIFDMTIFITSGYKIGCQALKVTEMGVEVLWRNKAISSLHSDPIIIDGFIYSYSGQSNQNKGLFKCVELNNGQEKWSTDEVGWGTVVYVDGHLLCMDIRGNIFLVEPNPSTFRKVTEFRNALGDVKHPAWTTPVIANGKLYLRYMQRLLCYNLK